MVKLISFIKKNFLLILILLIYISLNVYLSLEIYKKKEINLEDMIIYSINADMKKYSSHYLPLITSQLTTISLLNDQNLINEEFYRLTAYSSKFVGILDIPNVYSQKHIFEFYLILNNFNYLVSESSEGRSVIYENIEEFLDVFDKIRLHSNDMSSKIFKESLMELQKLITTK